MTLDVVERGLATTDDSVDYKITKFLDPKTPRSFFLYAGAGSGKTRSLVNALKAFRKEHGDSFRRLGKRVAVITYTNAACDEIASRVDDDPLFLISTIHSFCWSQIGPLNTDIQIWLKTALPNEIAELTAKQAKGRTGTRAALDRERSIAAKTKRLEWLNVPRRFTYNPNGDNFGADSLSHSEVLKITAHFVETKPSMQVLLASRFPFLLIDESQDTSKHLVDALFKLEAAHHHKFALGLFGDMMQRIYADGKPDLGQSIPERWAKPAKKMNHRSPRRIVQLGNTLRAPVDGQRQIARDDSKDGIARLFIAAADSSSRPAVEKQVRKMMSDITGDVDWADDGPAVKTLTLEHHMAASRMGFSDLFRALDQDSKLTTGLRNGDLAGVRLFSQRVAPLIAASVRRDGFAVMALLRRTSPLLKPNALSAAENVTEPLAKVRQAVAAVSSIDVTNPATTFMDVLKAVAAHDLFDIPDSLKPFVDATNPTGSAGVNAEYLENGADSEEMDAGVDAWRDFLESPYNQIGPYAEYVADIGAFGTHQGVKGLEFDRVLVVMDDSEARGFLFSYEKLLGAKPLSATDQKKISQGEEVGSDRTRRLLYVTCTRVQKSLALIAYSNAPDRLETAVVEEGWFEPSEIERL